MQNIPFQPQTLSEITRIRSAQPNWGKSNSKKAAGGLRTKRFEWQVGPRLFSGQLQAFCATLCFHQISRTWTKWVERLQTSLSDGAFRLSAFWCARILSLNWRNRAKGINLDCFMCACLELTLWNEKLYRNKHHSSARALKQNIQSIIKRSTVCMTERILHMLKGCQCLYP